MAKVSEAELHQTEFVRYDPGTFSAGFFGEVFAISADPVDAARSAGSAARDGIPESRPGGRGPAAFRPRLYRAYGQTCCDITVC